MPNRTTIVLYGAGPIEDINTQQPFGRIRFNPDHSAEESSTASQIAKLKLRRVELLRRIASAEDAKSELELVEKMLVAAGENL